MAAIVITRQDFLQDRQGRTFVDVLNDAGNPFEAVLAFFNAEDRQRRMQESETHHDRSPLAGVVRELEGQPAVDSFLSSQHPRRTKRLRQAVGVVVRMVMERLGWKKTGRKGSLGVRAAVSPRTPTPGAYHNTGGLALWFLRESATCPRAARAIPRSRIAPASWQRNRPTVRPPPNANGAKEAPMNAFRVWIRPLAGTCRLRVDGLQNAQWLINRLSQSFVFKTSEPLYDDLASGCANFAVQYSSHMPQVKCERLLAAIPEVTLIRDAL